MRKQSFVVLGGGLAGTWMATRLLDAGQEVHLIDAPRPDSASQVAAGLYNVITGRFGNRTWLAERLLSEWKSYLRQGEASDVQAWVHPSLIFRPFKEVAEYNKWSSRIQEPAYASLVSFQEQPLLPKRVHNPLGGLLIQPCGWVDIPPFLQALKLRGLGTGRLYLYEEQLPYQEIRLSTQQVQLSSGKLDFDHLICCEGVGIKENPFFAQVPIIPNKGEILIIKAPDLQLPWVLSRKIYVIPHEADHYVVGATYQRQFVNSSPSAEGRAELEALLTAAIQVPYEVLDHRAGLRPTSPNRRPVLGTHPTYPMLHLFNGLGTKGVLQDPYFSRLMCEYLLEGAWQVPADASLARFTG